MQKVEKRGHLWGEAFGFLVLVFLIVLASLWTKVYLDAKSYFLKAEGVFRRANETGRPGDLVRAGEAYLSCLKSYAPFHGSDRRALTRILAIGRSLEDLACTSQAEDLYRRTEAALSDASFFYLPHGNLYGELKERLEKIEGKAERGSPVQSPSGP